MIENVESIVRSEIRMIRKLTQLSVQTNIASFMEEQPARARARHHDTAPAGPNTSIRGC